MITSGVIATFLAICSFFLFMHSCRLSTLSLPEKLLFAVGGTIGLQSYLLFLGLILFGTISISWLIVEILFLGSLCLLLFLKSSPSTSDSPGIEKRNLLGAALATCFALSFIQCATQLLKVIEKAPHGGWDAWAIWNMRARFLLRSGEDWRRAFDSVYDWSHPDYPLLLPNTIIRIWTYLGFETQWVPALLGIGFMLATILLLFFSLRSMRSLGQGALMGVLFMMFPGAIWHSCSQFADTPLAFYFLATMVFVAHYDHTGGTKLNMLFLAGIFAGFAAWTKNEGILFIAVLVGVRGLLAIKNWKIKRGMLEVGSLLLGTLPFIFLSAYQGTLVTKNDLLTQQLGDILHKLGNWQRYQLIYTRFSNEFSAIGNNLIIILLCLLLFFPVRKFWRENECMMPILVFTGMVCGYFAVYLITPHDLQWHLSTSLRRLVYQLWPLLVFSFAMATIPPEKIFQDPVKESSVGNLLSRFAKKS